MTQLSDVVHAALKRCASRRLDSQAERCAVADEVVRSIIASPDAQRIRLAFRHATTSCTRLIVMRELGGAREAEVLDAAARLAGLGYEPSPGA